MVLTVLQRHQNQNAVLFMDANLGPLKKYHMHIASNLYENYNLKVTFLYLISLK